MKKIILLLLLIPLFAFGQYRVKTGINQGEGFQPIASSYKWSPEALAYINRYPVKPANDTCMIYAELIDSLVLNGVWNKLTGLVWCANRDTTVALLNMKGTSYTGISIGAPTFTPYKGFMCGTNKYINAMFNPTTANSNFTLNSASLGAYSNTDELTNGTVIMGLDLGGGRILITPIAATNSFQAVVHGASVGSGYNYHTIGLFSAIRSASNVTKGYIDTDSLFASSVVSTSMANGNIFVGCYNFYGAWQFSARQIAFYFWGELLTTDEYRNFSRCASRCLIKLGVDNLTRIVCDGNSLTGANPNYVDKLRDTLSGSLYSVVNKGIGGGTTEAMNAAYSWKVGHLPTHKKNILIYWEGTNSINSTGNLHADSVYREMRKYGLNAKATNRWDKIIVMTTLPFGTNDPKNSSRDTLNSLLISHYSEFSDTIINLCDNPDIGQWGDQLNTTFYADTIHLTSAGQAIVMRMVYAALKNLKIIV